MSIKQITAYDSLKMNDKSNIKGTSIEIKIAGTDITLFKRHNKVILPGAGFTARCHFDLPRDEVTPSYNTALGLENSVIETPSAKEKVYLFCVGTDGCGTEGSDVRVENYAKWISPDSLVGFRYPLLANDLTGSLREQYFGRKVVDGRAIYYFKTFDSAPVLYQRYVDGTAIDANVYDSDKTDEIETFVKLQLMISHEDCRDWFKQTTGINEARVNTVSLCTAWPKTFDGQIYYQDIRPLTKFNFPNEYLIDLTKGISVEYLLFY